MKLTLSKEDQGVVIFHVWKSLPYNARLILSFSLIAIGFFMQFNFIQGALLVMLAGNSLLFVKGYDNRIKLGKYSAEGEWVKTDKEHLDQIVEMNKKLEKWDRSTIDASNKLGVWSLIVFLAVLFGIYLYLDTMGNYFLQMLVIDAAVLFVPHWFFGLKRVTTTPLLLQKIKIYNNILESYKDVLDKFQFDFLIYVKGKDQKLPTDIKLKINHKKAPESFLGMYAQISMNNVEGKTYPYLYIVLVAKQELNIINKYFDKITPAKGIIKETSTERNTDIIIIRQYTTKSSGYFTKTTAIESIINTGIKTILMIIKDEVK